MLILVVADLTLLSSDIIFAFLLITEATKHPELSVNSLSTALITYSGCM